jgi:hypothetical protein
MIYSRSTMIPQQWIGKQVGSKGHMQAEYTVWMHWTRTFTAHVGGRGIAWEATLLLRTACNLTPVHCSFLEISI